MAALVCHALAWTLVPVLIAANPPLDVIEGFAWGREWQWGYYKHPPLQAWLLEAVSYITGRSGLGYFGMSALASAATMYAVYRTGLLIVTPAKAVLAALLCEGILYFNVLACEFNPNVLQLVIWAWAGWAFAHAVCRRHLVYWLLLGVLLSLGFYAKYSIVLLCVSLASFLFYDNKARLRLVSRGPYTAALLFALLILPQLHWLAAHDFLPMSYAASRLTAANNIGERLLFPLMFMGAQVLDALPMLLLFFLLQPFRSFWKSTTVKRIFMPLRRLGETRPLPIQAIVETGEQRFKRALLLWLAFAPAVLSTVFSGLINQKIQDMWGMPYLSFVPLWLVSMMPDELDSTRLRRFGIGWGMVFGLALIAFPVVSLGHISVGRPVSRTQFPGQELSREAHRLWMERTGQPLEIVMGKTWIAGNATFHSTNFRNRPHTYLKGNFAYNPWLSEEDIRRKGALVLWEDGHELGPDAMADHGIVEGGPPLQLTVEGGWKPRSVRVRWAVIMPAPAVVSLSRK
jgi:4-amino-4-deoxy-L-arabinose transferase-like glycosyltransferase